jgi:prepilin-type N-terminal cleavage/methylation domain-containing protein
MPRRRTRAGERGFTLIEVLVAITVVGLLMGALLVGFDIGIKTVGHGGAGDRAAGARDISSFEQQLSMDVTRAGCLSVGGAAYGACSQSVARGGAVISQCSTAVLCAAWSQSSRVSQVVGCHVDVYTQPSGAGKKVVRTEYKASSGTLTGLAAVNVTTADGVSMTATPATVTPASGGTWLSLLSVTITSSGVVKSPPTGTLQLRPLSVDPGGQAETVLC